MNKLFQKCPDCDGKGDVESFKDKYSDKYGHYTVANYMECDVCRGEGIIPSLYDFALAFEDLEVEVADILDCTPEAAGYIINQLVDEFYPED